MRVILYYSSQYNSSFYASLFKFIFIKDTTALASMQEQMVILYTFHITAVELGWQLMIEMQL